MLLAVTLAAQPGAIPAVVVVVYPAIFPPASNVAQDCNSTKSTTSLPPTVANKPSTVTCSMLDKTNAIPAVVVVVCPLDVVVAPPPVLLSVLPKCLVALPIVLLK